MLDHVARFTIKDLLIATMLIAIGLGTSIFVIQVSDWIFEFNGELFPLMFLSLWMGGGALIGAGLFTPFKRPLRGATIGAVIQFVVAFLLPGVH